MKKEFESKIRMYPTIKYVLIPSLVIEELRLKSGDKVRVILEKVE